MKDTSRQNERDGPKRPDEQAAESPQDRPVVSYTPEQRRMIKKGLRIWARVAVRSYMRKHPPGSQTEEGSQEGRCGV